MNFLLKCLSCGAESTTNDRDASVVVVAETGQDDSDEYPMALVQCRVCGSSVRAD